MAPNSIQGKSQLLKGTSTKWVQINSVATPARLGSNLTSVLQSEILATPLIRIDKRDLTDSRCESMEKKNNELNGRR